SRGGEQKRRLLRGAFQTVALLLQFVRRNRVDLVQRHDLDLVGEMSLISLKFGPHRLVGLAGVLAGRIDQVQQHAAALDVTEKWALSVRPLRASAGTNFSPSSVKSWISVSRSSSNIWVPTGTLSTIDLPSAPWRSLPRPLVPFGASKCCW